MDKQVLQLAAVGIMAYAQQSGKKISQEQAVQMVQQMAQKDPKQLQKFAQLGQQMMQQQQAQTMEKGAKIQYIKRLKGLI